MSRCELRTFDLRKISLYILTCILMDFSQMFTMAPGRQGLISIGIKIVKGKAYIVTLVVIGCS